jgi:hypothetical protein
LRLSTEVQHKLKAKHNERLLNKLRSKDTRLEFIDWSFVILYYSALHFGDAYLARRGTISIKNHSERIKKYGKELTRDVFVSYKILEGRSRIARYEPENSAILTETEFNKLYNDDFPKLKSLV